MSREPETTVPGEPYFSRFTKEPGDDWLVTVRITTTTQVNVYGGDEARARIEAELAVREEDTDVIEIVHVERIANDRAI